MSNNFRDILPALDTGRLKGISERDAYSHADGAMNHPFVRTLVEGWASRVRDPFVGITTHGKPVSGLYALGEEGAPTAAMKAAADRLLALVSDEERATLSHPVDAPQWRVWSNPELYVNRYGLRLDELSEAVREAILGVMRASLSPRGFDKARGCMWMNHFLGELVHAPKVMNQYSYNFLLFGEPSLTEPWGWNLYGHHLVLNCFVLGGQMVISPTFMGAEPNIIDAGPHAGLAMFRDEERGGLGLMQSLPTDLQARARVYELMKDPKMPEGRWHPADERHLGGASHDNRVIPYEGIAAGELSAAQRKTLLGLVERFIEYLPSGPLAARMEAIERRLDETWFCWIGGFGDEDPFYYRIQSPVIMTEFDHQSGIFLTNAEPAKCHIHTVVRTPNGNDYGKDLLRQHYAQVHPGAEPGRG